MHTVFAATLHVENRVSTHPMMEQFVPELMVREYCTDLDCETSESLLATGSSYTN